VWEATSIDGLASGAAQFPAMVDVSDATRQMGISGAYTAVKMEVDAAAAATAAKHLDVDMKKNGDGDGDGDGGTEMMDTDLPTGGMLQPGAAARRKTRFRGRIGRGGRILIDRLGAPLTLTRQAWTQ
jgi:hypothetical protein